MYDDFLAVLRHRAYILEGGVLAEPITASPKLLEVLDLKMHFPIKHGFFRSGLSVMSSVDGVSFYIHVQTLGLVGRERLRQTTTGRVCCARMTDRGKFGSKPQLGRVNLRFWTSRSSATAPEHAVDLQDPYSSLILA